MFPRPNTDLSDVKCQRDICRFNYYGEAIVPKFGYATEPFRREVIHRERKCGRPVHVAPYKLIDQYDGVRPTTPVWNLKDWFKCKMCQTRPPKRMWIDRWLD